jgi:hypothetical protein
VPGTVNIPVLQDLALGFVGMNRAGIAMASGYLPTMHLLLRARPSEGLFDDLSAVAWMHGSVAVAMKNK